MKMNKRILWKKIKQRGPILEDDTNCPSHFSNDNYPATYYLDNNYFDSYSALIPEGGKKCPHRFIRWHIDEEADMDSEWELGHVYEPLKWQTEKEFLAKKAVEYNDTNS